MKRVLSLLVVLVLIAAGLLYFQFGTLVEHGTRQYGPEILKVDVGLDSVSLSPFTGETSLKGLSLGQPEGFGDGTMASLGAFEMKLQPRSLLSNHIIIDDLTIDALELNIIVRGKNTNFKAFAEGLDSIAAADQPASDGEEITLTVHRLSVMAPKASVDIDSVVKAEETLALADFTLTNLGTDEKGLAPREIARHIVDALQPQIARALVKAQAGDKLKDLAKGAEGKLKKGLTSLLKGKKKDDEDPETQN